jgi:hypothetical protein
MVPDVRLEERERPVTVYRQVPETRTERVVRAETVAVPVCDPCTGLASLVCAVVPHVENVCVTVFRCVAECHLERYTVAVPTARPETRSVTVPVPGVREEVVTERVPVTTLQPERRAYAVSVPVPRREVVEYRVPVRELVPKVETYRVRVCEQRPEVRVRRVPVTVVREVQEVVAETVPCRVPVEVPCQVTVCVPVFCGCW